MAMVRNVSGRGLIVPELHGQVVDADEVVEVPDVRLSAFLEQSSVWADETPAGGREE